ncbi:hypothetical protein PROPEN_02951 [Proteus penneri ATCC 35198]|nr:hypothetical protein PROPEN_02951 [Proteus penneri ATCC 35198]
MCPFLISHLSCFYQNSYRIFCTISVSFFIFIIREVYFFLNINQLNNGMSFAFLFRVCSFKYRRGLYEIYHCHY